MKDDELQEDLDDFLRSYRAPWLTDSFVDAFMASPVESSPESVERMHKLYVEKCVRDLGGPVRRIGEFKRFGEWISQRRKFAGLGRRDVAQAFGKETSFIEAVETERTPPWKLQHEELANLASLFRLHINALSELLSNTFKALSEPLPSHSKFANMDFAQPISSPRSRAPREDDPASVNRAVNAVRLELQRRQATDLLD